MQFLVVFLILSCVSYSTTLVHRIKLEKGADGCKTEAGTELKVGQFVNDKKVCGGVRCESKEGDALIYYCQVPLPFAGCTSRSINTQMDFPVCCWTCVESVPCKDGKPVDKKDDKEKDNKEENKPLGVEINKNEEP